MKKRILTFFLLLILSVSVIKTDIYGDQAGPDGSYIFLGIAAVGTWVTPKIAVLVGEKTDLDWTLFNMAVSSVALTGEVIAISNGHTEFWQFAAVDGIFLLTSIYRLIKRSDWLKEKKLYSSNFDFFASPGSFVLTYKVKF